MNENIDLTKILKDCPIGEEFYSPMLGDVVLHHINHKKKRIYVILKILNIQIYINSDGTLTLGDVTSKEIMLYPSREMRNWSNFTAPWYKKEKFDPKKLKPFDRVIVREKYGEWFCTFFSHIKETKYPYNTATGCYSQCIPYNDNTKHLIGTNKEAPEYYRYWEE